MKNQKFDIRKYKKDLRKRYKALRGSLDPKTRERKDRQIMSNITSMREYKSSKLFLCYVSTAQEINTHNLIEKAIRDGKAVAVPYCIEGTREMDFYKIQSLSELEPRTFGVLEPVAKPENKVESFDYAFCVLPGLSFDRFGYRLGYGGGYYDRFLSQKYKGTTAGICYQAGTRAKIIHGRYDVPCDYIVTEKGIRKRHTERIKHTKPR